MVFAVYLLTLVSLGLLWKYPLLLWRINQISLFTEGKLPDWMGGGEASLGMSLS